MASVLVRPGGSGSFDPVSPRSAVDPDYPAVSIGILRGALPRGLAPSGRRQDRILNEAAVKADPLTLMRLFGITEKTAVHYATAAHPERTSKPPPGGWWRGGRSRLPARSGLPAPGGTAAVRCQHARGPAAARAPAAAARGVVRWSGAEAISELTSLLAPGDSRR
ncbi:hypothetical protein [Streptomyces subrutilus]|uniref:hypothetical protein n=1 Tax=Streptomyces subrutilus TaxID=36818 RepID=UPI0033EAC468